MTLEKFKAVQTSTYWNNKLLGICVQWQVNEATNEIIDAIKHAKQFQKAELKEAVDLLKAILNIEKHSIMPVTMLEIETFLEHHKE